VYKPYDRIIRIWINPGKHCPGNDNPHIDVKNIVKNKRNCIKEITDYKHNELNLNYFPKVSPSCSLKKFETAPAIGVEQ
jgi:hypothetical protein